MKLLKPMKTHLTLRAAVSALALVGWLLLPQTGHCFYNPTTGRWISRDPATDGVASNMYAMVDNDALDKWDVYGLRGQTSFSLHPAAQFDRTAYNDTPRLSADNSRLVWLRSSASTLGYTLKYECRLTYQSPVYAMSGTILGVIPWSWDEVECGYTCFITSMSGSPPKGYYVGMPISSFQYTKRNPWAGMGFGKICKIPEPKCKKSLGGGSIPPPAIEPIWNGPPDSDAITVVW
jgi:hypothetical protein